MLEETAELKALLFQQALARLHLRGIRAEAVSTAFFVPGRIEVLGKHTDYAGGRSIVCAVDRGICIVAVPRPDRQIRIWAGTPADGLRLDLSSDLKPAPGHGSNYFITVARRVAQNFSSPLVGADIALTSDLPQAAGLSSSSALITAFFLTLSAVNRLDTRQEYQLNINTPIELASYLATIENGQTFGTLRGDLGVGTFGGSEDHTAVLNAVPRMLSQYSFCPTRLERSMAFPAGFSLVIADSGVCAEKTCAAMTDYNTAATAASDALHQWRHVSGKNDATLAAAIEAAGVEEVRASMSDLRLRERLDHFVAESVQIIPAAGDALIARRLNDFGLLVDTSQRLAESLLKNQVPQTIALAGIARQRGAVAASSFGAGFGGSVWAMVSTPNLNSFVCDWQAGYLTMFPDHAKRAQFFKAFPGPPAIQIQI